jgi:hypothetical protein
VTSLTQNDSLWAKSKKFTAVSFHSGFFHAKLLFSFGLFAELLEISCRMTENVYNKRIQQKA